MNEPCRICGTRTVFFAVMDFNRTCMDKDRGPQFALAHKDVVYNRCPDCGFIQTDLFNNWHTSDFVAAIYNADYHKTDPDSLGRRAEKTGTVLLNYHFLGQLDRLRFLDYGCGEGLLVDYMRQHGVADITGYDRFNPKYAARPTGKFDVILCYEVLEHVQDQRELLLDLSNFLAPKASIVFSTLLQPQGVQPNWWYIAPRNGHCSIHCEKSLLRLMDQFGLVLLSNNAAFHMAFRQMPDYAKPLVKGGERECYYPHDRSKL